MGRTRIQKVIDLMRLDTKIPVKILYEPYRFGDFSDQLVKVLGILADNKFIEIPNEQYEQFQEDTVTEYLLTEDGNKIAKKIVENLSTEIKDEVLRIWRIGSVPLQLLIRICYFWFPETAEKSEMKPKLFPKKFEDFPNDLLVGDYEEIKRTGMTIKELIRQQWKESS